MKRSIAVMVVLALAAGGSAVAYQAAARDRAYRTLLARGDAALGDDEASGAIEAYTGALTLRPDSILAHLRRAEIYERRGDLDAAARDFRTAAGLDPGATRPLEELGSVLYQQQKFRQAAETYEACLRLDDRSARVSYKLALARYREGNLDAALAAIVQAIRLNDRLPDAFYLEGVCLRDKGRAADARRALEQAVALSPGFIAAREELADLYGGLGRRGDELEQLQVLAGLDHDHIERQVAIGRAHARAGHLDLAVLTLGNALERTPGQPLIYAALGQIWLDMAPSRSDALSKALEALQRAAAGATATSDVLTLYGRALLRDRQFDAAEPVLRQASERYPIDPASLLLLATAAEHQNHLRAARQALVDFTALAGETSEFASHATHIAALSARLNDLPTAVRWFDRAVAVKPDDLRLAVLLADAELRAGDRAAAAVTIARGLEKDPTHDALRVLERRLH